MTVKETISKRKTEQIEHRVNNCEGVHKKLFSIIHSLFGWTNITVLPEYKSFFHLNKQVDLLRKLI